MKTLKLTCAVLAALSLAACSDDNDGFGGGEGRIMLNASINSDVKVVSRASSDELKEELSESFLLWISSPKGLVRKYEGLDNVPADGVVLPSGSYVAEAWAGDSVSASWDKRWFKCYVPFEVSKAATTNVDLNLKIANVVASVEYDPSVNDVLKDYTFTIGHDRGELQYIPDATPDRGYFMMPSTDKDLHYTLTGKKNDGTIFSRTGVINNVKSGYEYKIKVTAAKESDPIGGGVLDIVVDESEILVDANIVITLAPMINGVGYDINEEQFYNAERGHISAYVSAAADLKSVVLTSEAFPTALGIGQNDFDYVYVRDNNPTVLDQFAAKGLIFAYTRDEAADLSNLKINFEDELLGALDSGTYTFKIEATDTKDHTTVRTLTITVSNDPIILETIGNTPGVAFAHKCTVTSKIAAASGVDASASHVEYRVASGAQGVISRAAEGWMEAPCYISGNNICADLEGLDATTTYEYYFVTPDFSTAVDRFTTEGTFTLPNASFEETQGSAPTLLYTGDESNMFWDSGNHGSKTMGKDVTTPDTQYKHSGNQSLKLASQFVGLGIIGKFAAGNVFIGKYLDTQGTDGVLGWGRDCTARPVALKGWVRYEPRCHYRCRQKRPRRIRQRRHGPRYHLHRHPRRQPQRYLYQGQKRLHVPRNSEDQGGL